MESSFLDIEKWVKQLSEGANLLGALQASAVWALFSGFVCYLYWTEKKHHEEYDKEWMEVRIQQANALEGLANAMSKIADNYKELKTIIDERLHKEDR